MVGEECARRPEGQRALVYLDQSTLSDLAHGNLPRLGGILNRAAAADLIVCPTSDATDEETKLAKEDLRDALVRLSDELSLGIRFSEMRLTEWNELDAAARSFLEKGAAQETWREAFHDDPQAAREKLFPSGFRLSVKFPVQEWEQQEVEHTKGSELCLAQIYELVQKEGRTFEQQAKYEQEATLRWRLGWLFAEAEFEARFERAKLEAAIEMFHAGAEAMFSLSSAYNRYSALYLRKKDNESFLERHPELRDRRDEFWAFLMTGPIPALRLPALIRAGLAVTRGRKPRAGDAYDVVHLTRGLSRCHFVTADSGMTQLCRDRGLVPPGCELFGTRETAALEARLERLFASS